MVVNYLKIALRNILRQKGFSLITVAGLALGLASSVVVLLNVKREFDVNRNFENVERLFRVSSKWRVPNMGIYMTTMAPVGPLMKENLPGVRNAVRLWPGSIIVNAGDRAFRENITISDTSYFQVFRFNFLHGSAETAFMTASSIVITENLAMKLFGQTDVLGKTIDLQTYRRAGRTTFRITGVLRVVPTNSTTTITGDEQNLFVSTRDLGDFFNPAAFTDWDSRYLLTFVELDRKARPQEVEHNLAKLLARMCPENIRNDVTLVLDPLTTVHFTDAGGAVLKNLESQAFFAIIMLLIACLNFINLNTAASIRRSKEIGVRKVLGGRRVEIVRQFLFEAILLSLMALVLAYGLVRLLAIIGPSQFSGLVPHDIHLTWGIGIVVLGITLLTSLAAGIYPAFVISRFDPTAVLKSGTAGQHRGSMRRVLVMVQFSAATFLIISSLTISGQLNFLLTRNVGFEKDGILVIKSLPRHWNADGIRQQEVFRDRLQTITGIRAASLCWGVPGQPGSEAMDVRTPDGHKLSPVQLIVDDHYARVFGLDVVKGRFFGSSFLAEDSTTSVVLNEAAAQALDLSDPVGQSIETTTGRRMKIIGVVRNFAFSAAMPDDAPLVMVNVYAAGIYRLMAVNIGTTGIDETLSAIRSMWGGMFPDVPFEYEFMDQIVNQQYGAVLRVRALTHLTTVLALFIASIGLFGLALFSVQQRRKEIGVRKVLGASVPGIVLTLIREFLIPVVWANVLAWPIAYLVMHQWLQGFVYRIDMEIWMFVVSAAMGAVVACATISYQAIRSALANPVEALRYE